jgi:P4 family phage/plasmid primase-like protien
VNHGSGRNGKGTLDEVMQNILGEYAWPLTSAAILRRRNEVHSSVILDLRGKRYVSVNEVDDGDRLSVADACRLTGGDRLTASRKHKDAEVFRPTAKLTVWLNPLFEVGSTKDAIWERLLLVEWPVNFSKLGKADGKLKERLRQESSGILNALVRACREWQEVGLLPPKSVLDAVQAYRREDDVERRFIEEHYVLDARSAVRSDVLYDRYKNWCRTVGKMPKKLKGFIIALKDIDGIATGTRDEKNYATVTGIRLTTESPHLQVVQSAPRGLTGESLTRFREISQLLFKPSKGCLAVSSIHKTWSSYVDSYVEEDIPVGTVEDLGATLRALGMNVGLDAKKILAVQGITFVSTEEFRAAYYRKFKTKPWEQWDSDDDNDDESDDGSDDAGLDAEERDMDGGYSEEEASR